MLSGPRPELKLKPFLVPGKVDQQRIRISVGDRSVGEFRLTKDELQVVRITIPNETFEGSDLTVVLGLPDAESQVTINAGGDARDKDSYVNRALAPRRLINNLADITFERSFVEVVPVRAWPSGVSASCNSGLRPVFLS